MAFEWGQYGIRANTVSPGAVMTQRVLSRARHGGSRGAVSGRVDIVVTSVDELANAIVFLLSDLASGISGQTISVEFGLSTKFCGGRDRSRSTSATRRSSGRINAGSERWNSVCSTNSMSRSPGRASIPGASARSSARAYRDNIEQIVLADKMGFDTVWCVEHHFRENRSHMPSNEVVLGALSQITKNIKLGFGVTLDAARIHPSGARRREGGDGRPAVRADGCNGASGRSTPMEQIAFRVDKRAQQGEDARGGPHRRRHVGAAILRGALGVPRLSEADGDAEALSVSASAVLDGADASPDTANMAGAGRLRPAVLQHPAAAEQAEAGDRCLSRGAENRDAA